MWGKKGHEGEGHGTALQVGAREGVGHVAKVKAQSTCKNKVLFKNILRCLTINEIKGILMFVL